MNYRRLYFLLSLFVVDLGFRMLDRFDLRCRHCAHLHSWFDLEKCMYHHVCLCDDRPIDSSDKICRQFHTVGSLTERKQS